MRNYQCLISVPNQTIYLPIQILNTISWILHPTLRCPKERGNAIDAVVLSRTWSAQNKMSCCFLFLSPVLIASHVHSVFQMDESLIFHPQNNLWQCNFEWYVRTSYTLGLNRFIFSGFIFKEIGSIFFRGGGSTPWLILELNFF